MCQRSNCPCHKKEWNKIGTATTLYGTDDDQEKCPQQNQRKEHVSAKQVASANGQRRLEQCASRKIFARQDRHPYEESNSHHPGKLASALRRSKIRKKQGRHENGDPQIKWKFLEPQNLVNHADSSYYMSPMSSTNNSSSVSRSQRMLFDPSDCSSRALTVSGFPAKTVCQTP